jgi:hypothetical protein
VKYLICDEVYFDKNKDLIDHMLSFHEMQSDINDRVIPFIIALQRRIDALEERMNATE